MSALELAPRLLTELDALGARLAQLHPYERAWEVEAWSLAQTDPSIRRACGSLWTPRRMAAVGGAELEAKLRALGLEGLDEAVNSERGTSAWAVGERFSGDLGRPATSHEELFLGLAACVLWKRLRADTPSDEMVYDRLVEGELLAAKKQFREACDLWASFWEVVRGRMPRTQRRASGVKGLFRGGMLEPWAERYCTALVRASTESEVGRVYGERAAGFVDDFITLFPGTAGTPGWVLHATKARFQVLRGRQAEGFARFEALVREAPLAEAPYRALLDAFLAAEDVPEALRGRVVAMAKKALAQGVDRDGVWGLLERVEELRSRAG